MEAGCRCIMQYQDNTKTIYAGFAVRLAAYLFDSLFVGSALLLIRVPVFCATLFSSSNPVKNPFLFEFSIYDIVLYLISVAYFVFMTYGTGYTLGKRIMNLKVVREDGEKLTLLNVLYRETIGRYLSSIIIFIGYIMIALDDQKRGIHDRLCDTRVIYNFRVPEQIKEREPQKKYAWVCKVKEECVGDFVKMHLLPASELLDSFRKAGCKNFSVFQNGNEFLYEFESDNIKFANDYMKHNENCKKWNAALALMLEEPAETSVSTPSDASKYLQQIFYLK